jgi:succinate dehydrogenase/fumarate reductase flavoprotein subunit
LYETPAKTLIKKDGEIVGVVAEQKGKSVNIKAKRAVVLTCGGFENNQAMIRNYLSDLPYCYPSCTPYNTGDGIHMAMDVGADLWHMNNLSGPYFYFKAPTIPVASRIMMPRNNYIWVGGDGFRFSPEAPAFVHDEQGHEIYTEKHGKELAHGRYVQKASPVPIWLIFDETTRKAGAICGKSAGWTFSWEVLHGNLYDWSKDNTKEIEKGWIKKADTIAELAKAVALSPDALEQTVKRYNGFCQDRKDLDFGRQPASMLPLQTPPFYAMQLVPSFLNTQGGPRHNKDAQIVDTEGKPIPRLYAAGELGSIYGFVYQGGGNWAECLAFGRVAARNAVALKSWDA